MSAPLPGRRPRVVYDHRIFSAQQFGGISRYFSELAAHLAAQQDWRVNVLALAHVNAYVQSLDARTVRGWRVPRLARTARVRQALNDWMTRRLLRQSPPDLVHETYYGQHASAPAAVPAVVTVYDMIHERFPQHFPNGGQHARDKTSALQRAAHIICISESTRADLLATHAIDPRRVSVVHLASSLVPPPECVGPPDALAGRPYILFVGQRGGHKNFAGLLRALAAHRRGPLDHTLALYGGGPLTLAERALMAKGGLPVTAVVHMGSDEAALGRLYRHASAFVYPSLYEGFGIPILEAMACRCPVICGSTSSMPEVAGNAAAYCDAANPDSIAAVLSEVLASPAYSDRLRDLGAERQQRFSWDRCAAETGAIYSEVVGRSADNARRLNSCMPAPSRAGAPHAP